MQAVSEGAKISPSWVPTKSEKMQEHVKFSLIHHLSKESLDLAETVVPWYLEMLPAAYFREVGESTRKRHLKGIAALKGIDQDMSLTLNSMDDENNAVVTVLRNDARPGTLNDIFCLHAEQQERSLAKREGVLCFRRLPYIECVHVLR